LSAFFGDLSEHAIRDGSFESVNQLVQRIDTYIAEHNLEPKRYQWKADGAEILAKIQGARQKLSENRYCKPIYEKVH
jgi:hypothetical protein